MPNIVKLKTMKHEIDSAYEHEVEIDIDEYIYFTVDFRVCCWNLIGHKFDENYKWTKHELSYHWVDFRSMVDFIVKANNVKDKSGFTRCRVSTFSNLHYSDIFYEELARLLEAVEKEQERLKELQNG